MRFIKMSLLSIGFLLHAQTLIAMDGYSEMVKKNLTFVNKNVSLDSFYNPLIVVKPKNDEKKIKMSIRPILNTPNIGSSINIENILFPVNNEFKISIIYLTQETLPREIQDLINDVSSIENESEPVSIYCTLEISSSEQNIITLYKEEDQLKCRYSIHE